MSNITDVSKKYKFYISNIEWHIKTNTPPEEEVKKLNKQIDIYKEVVSDLAALQQNKVSDVSAEEIEEASQRAYPFLRNSDIDTMKNRETFKTGANWYASIVNERKDNVVVNDWKSVIKNRIDYFNDRYHYHEANRLSDALININELIPTSDFESQPQKEEVNEDELWYEVMLESEASRSYPDFFERCKKRFSITRK